MKKLVITTVCSLAIASGAFAQGVISWNTIAPTYVKVQTNSTQYSPLLGGGATGSGGASYTGVTGNQYYYELLFTSYTTTAAPAPTTLTQLATWTDSGLSATNNGSQAGFLSPVNPTVAATVNGFSQGGTSATNSILLVGWSANLGTTYANALANLGSTTYLASLSAPAFFGISTVGYLQGAANGSSVGASPVGTGAITASGDPINSVPLSLYLVPVPEPSTIAMAAFGGLSLLALRRKK